MTPGLLRARLLAVLALALLGVSFALDWALMKYNVGFVAAPHLLASYAIFTEAAAVAIIAYLLWDVGMRRSAAAFAAFSVAVFAFESLFPQAVSALWRAVFG